MDIDDTLSQADTPTKAVPCAAREVLPLTKPLRPRIRY